MAMQKKEKTRGGAAGAAGGGAAGPRAAPVTLGLFLLPGGRLLLGDGARKDCGV
jgi:hypothetical protein